MLEESTSSDSYGIRTLDYPKAVVKMHITSPMESKYRIVACRKEPWTVEFIESLERGSWFLDVGANVGSYTLIAVANSLRVCAIEPSIDSAHRLRENLRLNDWSDRAAIYVGALSDVTGLNFFSPADLRPGYNDHVFGQHKHKLQKRADIYHTDIIPTLRLDDLMPMLAGDMPVAMKIDVDGGESAVLAGGTQTLKGGRLNRLMLELGRAGADGILAALDRDGWRVVRRIGDSGDEGLPDFGKDRFRDMFYVWLERG